MSLGKKKINLDTETDTHRERNDVKRQRRWHFTSQGMPEEARKPKANPSLVPSESRHSGFRLLEFRTVKQYGSVVLSHSVCGTLLQQSLLMNMLISVELSSFHPLGSACYYPTS